MPDVVAVGEADRGADRDGEDVRHERLVLLIQHTRGGRRRRRRRAGRRERDHDVGEGPAAVVLHERLDAPGGGYHGRQARRRQRQRQRSAPEREPAPHGVGSVAAGIVGAVRRPRMSYTATGWAKPRRVMGPTGFASTSTSVSAYTCWLTRIWPSRASWQRRALRLVTLPMAA